MVEGRRTKRRLAGLLAAPLMLVPSVAMAQDAVIASASGAGVYGPVLEAPTSHAASSSQPLVITAVVPFDGDAIPVDAGLGVQAEDAEAERKGLPKPARRTAAYTLGIGLGLVAVIGIISVAQD